MQDRPTLLARTVQLLHDTDRSYLEIYSGTGLTPSWLTQLSVGKIKDPSVNKVQALYEYLATDELVY